MLRADMKRTVRRRASAFAACALAACAIFWHGDAHAQTAPSHELTSVLARIAEQEERLNAQERLLREQQQQITDYSYFLLLRIRILLYIFLFYLFLLRANDSS